MMRHYRTLWRTRRGPIPARRFAGWIARLFSQNAKSDSRSRRLGNAGFTLIEIAFACEVIMLLTLIGYNESHRMQQHARVAACLSYQAALQRTLWGEYALVGEFPNNINPVLATMPSTAVPVDFSYAGGLGGGTSGDYYLRCNHDHSYVAVLFVDSGSLLPPKAIYHLGSARGNIP